MATPSKAAAALRVIGLAIGLTCTGAWAPAALAHGTADARDSACPDGARR